MGTCLIMLVSSIYVIVICCDKSSGETASQLLQTVEGIKVEDLFQRITDVIEFAEEKRPYKPTTIRILSFSKAYTDLVALLESTCKYPVVHLDKNISSQLLRPQYRKNNQPHYARLFTFITLIFFTDSSNFDSLTHVIKNSVDPKRDFVIFISKGKSIDKLRKLKGLREKYIIDISSADGVWVEPLHYNGNMVIIDKIRNIQIARPMGANLPGRHIRASAPETPPFNYKAGVDSKGNVIVDGTLCRIFVEASKKFNFSIFIGYEGYDYGTLHPNGTWTGSYSKVHYPDSGYDMDLIVSSELLWNQLDVAAVATYIDMIFGVSHPRANQHWYAFLLPFDNDVWMWCFIMFIVLGAVQGFVMYLRQGRKLKTIVLDASSLLPFSIAMEQGLQDIPIGMRYFSLILLFGCTVLGTGYKSTLRTHLMFPKPDPVPTTFEELADRVDYGVTLTVNGALEKHFWATSEVHAVKKIRERLTFDNNWEHCYKNAFLNRKHACVSWVHGKAVVAKTMTLNTTVEPVIYSKDAAIRKFLSLGFQENSIYVDSFSPITGMVNAMGIVSKWEEIIWTEFKNMGRETMLNQTDTEIFKELFFLAAPKPDQVPLQLQSLFVVIGFIPLGGLAGAIAFVVELYLFSKRNGKIIAIEEDRSETKGRENQQLSSQGLGTKQIITDLVDAV